MNRDFLRFISKVKYQKQFELFLSQYQNLEPGKFAIIKISGSTLERQLDSLSDDLVILQKLNLIPLVVHGAGSALDSAVSKNKLDGIRITGKDDIKAVEKITNELTKKFIDEIDLKGSMAINLSTCIECEYLEYNKYGHVGKITGIDIEKIFRSIKNGFIPVFSNLGFDKSANVYNINADSVAQALFSRFNPNRLFFLTDTSGVLDSNGHIISNININDDVNAFGGMKFKLDTIKLILDEFPDSAAVVTSANNLLREIFTIKGSGTFISNFKINSINKGEDYDDLRLIKLLESSFGKLLKPNYEIGKFERIYLHNDYKAVAVIDSFDGLIYLSKFAVAPSHRGTGLAKYLWNMMTTDFPSFVWRSKTGNPANNFYNARCSGFIKVKNWNVYWVGLKFLPYDVVEKIAAIDESFV